MKVLILQTSCFQSSTAKHREFLPQVKFHRLRTRLPTTGNKGSSAAALQADDELPFIAGILYVGESHTGNLAKTIKRHFWDWQDDPERRHFTYHRQRVEVAVRLTPPNTARTAQDNLIRRTAPRDNASVPVDEPF